jgi:hypothetical protein
MSKDIQHKTLLVVGVVVVVPLLVWAAWHFVKPKPPVRVLEKVLADSFNRAEGVIVPNVPSRAGRYPGALLARVEDGHDLVLQPGSRPDFAGDSWMSLKGIHLASGDGALELAGHTFGLDFESAKTIEVELLLDHLRILEVTNVTALAAELRQNPALMRARTHRPHVSVVTASYEAVPTVIVRQRGKVEASDWSKIKGELLKERGEVGAGDSVVFASSAPQVIAYETMSAEFVSDNFGDAGAVQLKTEPAHARLPLSLRSFGAAPAGKRIAFSVFVSAQCTSTNFGNLPAASSSASFMTNLLSELGLEYWDTGLGGDPFLDSQSFSGAKERLIERLKKEKPDAFILYYAGHGVAAGNGAQYLVLGDYDGDIKRDLAQDKTPLRADRPESPLNSGNLADLASLATTLERELAGSKPGLISVAELHSELEQAGVPFALLVDGCYGDKGLESLRRELKFTPWGDYYGVKGFPTTELTEYYKAVDEFGKAPYLRSANAVVLAAKPGSFARETNNPFYDSDLVPKMGYLAARAGTMANLFVGSGEPKSVGEFVRGLADFHLVGERNFQGSISWSDFSSLNEIPMITFH